MKRKNYILLLLLLPVIAFAQTVHIDSERVVYKGKIKAEQVNADELYARAQTAVSHTTKGMKQEIISDSTDKEKLAVKGSIALRSPYPIVKSLEYILELSIDKGNYQYRIDSVYVVQKERGGETSRLSSKKILEGMNVSGPVAASAERQLNEIDMIFQALLDRLRTDLQGLVSNGK